MEFSDIYNTGYEVIFVAFSAILVTQIIKCLLHLIVKRKIDLRLFTTTGGMPSSHSAGVVGLSTAVGLINGFSSVEFAIALGYAFIVMYDAAGVRRAAGKQAACLNRIIMDVYKQDLAEAGGKLKELLGHTPMQVFVGAIFGVFYACYIHQLLGGIN
ncbi:divergent PAP2 family protein [bacterium]|nr:divergent PAP2 family protein [bacterium]MBR1776085.1 divergent PAP2 family protein [bacterium]